LSGLWSGIGLVVTRQVHKTKRENVMVREDANFLIIDFIVVTPFRLD
jgi:hypothetical protein